jgi:hypothetical protein
MAADPAVTWGAQVLSKGYKVTGDVKTGIKGSVPYLVPWRNTFFFTNAILGPVTAVKIGPLSFFVPYQFHGADVPCYAQRWTVEPVGLDESTGLPISEPTYKGLRAGEFWSHAIVTVEFEQVPWTFQGIDDPQGLNQLDPLNPLTYCEQQIKLGGKMVTRKGMNYVYIDDGKPVQGDVGELHVEAKLICKFPRVAYLPWTLLQPYIGKVNSGEILLCDTGTLLLEGADTGAKASLNSPTPIEQSVQLEFAWDPLGWNNAPKPDGTMVGIKKAGDGTDPYDQADFGEIFMNLEFTSEGGD